MTVDFVIDEVKTGCWVKLRRNTKSQRTRESRIQSSTNDVRARHQIVEYFQGNDGGSVEMIRDRRRFYDERKDVSLKIWRTLCGGSRSCNWNAKFLGCGLNRNRGFLVVELGVGICSFFSPVS